ncbi:MAG TPA: FAD-dependent oxidoreductase [Baekduia sp.]|uniref:NAD(P)/FAD-dependent oxidoreductase n=1 Tax=Baekduia sp. TaxID=2600305 RepID=UPI002D78ADD9|nr:FAD-dependent oxidoreductase [Baekduia sp.]HET6507776.1 FAD-dependent oxidoreductase [Baekduia sp.]
MSATRDPATRTASSVFWLQQALERDDDVAAPLEGALRADVCVVGGGFAGLWTAYELVALDPSLHVVVVEARRCGFGASGRNGGWATSWVDEIAELEERFGAAQAAWLAERSTWAIDRMEEVCGIEGIDCHMRRSGALVAATAPAQAGGWEHQIEVAERLGRPPLQRVSGDELRARTGSPVLLDGTLMREGAAIQPALLVRGLRRALLRRGVRIFEHTPMTSLRRGQPATVVTPGGHVTAGKVVLALGAWAARVRELRRAVVPVGSHIVLTEPIPERIERLGWTGGELLGDTRLLVHYAQVTRDGRIAFGRGGGAIGPGGHVMPRHFTDPKTVDIVAAGFRRWFPQLSDVKLTHAWGGAVDRAPGHMPFAGSLGEGVQYVTGFSGNGVAPSVLLGRIAAHRALDLQDEYTNNAISSGPPSYLPPEPARFLGGVVVRDAVRRAEGAEEAGREPGPVSDALRKLVWFTTPRWLEPRL